MKAKNSPDIAIVGMSCIFPGARNLDAYWQNILEKRDSLQPAPEHRISEVFYDPNNSNIDRHSVRKGGFIDEYLEFDPLEFGMVPNIVEKTEIDHLVSLKLTKDALQDAGVFDKNLSLENSGIIIGKGNFGGLEAHRLNEVICGADNVVRFLKALCPDLPTEQIQSLKRAYQAQFGEFNSQNIMGTVPNLVAALVANRFNFGGPAYTLDAACASSLLGIEHAVRELKYGHCDLVVAGAIHLSQSPGMFSFFDTLGALSKNEVIRPFDQDADGVLTGEGCGFVVLRRLADARRDRHRIYAVIKGVGVSSDGSYASVMSPASEGQVKAINRAWQQAELNPSDVDFLEAHGTGTVLGDKTELKTLQDAFPHKQGDTRAGLGAVKAMIGHAMAAAGMAGFMKAALAIHKSTIPPTVNCDRPLKELEESHFRIVGTAEKWPQKDGPRLAGVNAFGFGGSNAHVVLSSDTSTCADSHEQNDDKVLLLARDSADELATAIKTGDYRLGSGTFRLVIFNPTPKRLDTALRVIAKGTAWRGRQDIWYTNRPMLESNEAKTALLFPGLDALALSSLNLNDIRELAEYYCLDSHLDEILEKTDERSYLLEEYQRLIYLVLQQMGITTDACAGHSLGEWTACVTTGLFDMESVRSIRTRVGSLNYSELPATYISVSCEVERAENLIREFNDVYVANDNCSQQIVLAAADSEVERVTKLFMDAGIVVQILPFKTGYHSPFCEIYREDTRFNVEQLLKIKLSDKKMWSCISAERYPDSVDGIKSLQIDFMTKRVRFREMIKNMHRDGFRSFIQLGNGALSGFIGDILPKTEYTLISCGHSSRSTLRQLDRVIASLWLEGKDVSLAPLNRVVDKKATKKQALLKKIDASFPRVDFEKMLNEAKMEPLSIKARAQVFRNNIGVNGSSSADDVISSLRDNLQKIDSLQNSLKTSLASNVDNNTSDRLRVVKRSIVLSKSNFPYIADHCPFKKFSVTDNFESDNEPVVPFTFFIDYVIETFINEFPGRVPKRIRNVKIHRFVWLDDEPEHAVSGLWLSDTEMHFRIGDIFEAIVCLQANSKTTFSPNPKSGSPRTPPVIASEIYPEAYMFHGPSYQGIKELLSFSENHLETEVSAVDVKGALLDNMGQTLGLLNNFMNRCVLSFPVAIDQVDYYQSPIDQDGVFVCTAHLTHEDNDFYYSTIELLRDGRPWARFLGWKTKKLDLDIKGWQLINRAESHALSSRVADGVFSLSSDRYRHTNSWFVLANIYFHRSEYTRYKTLSVADKKRMLMETITAKDAIKDLVFRRLGRVFHPGSICLLNEEDNKQFECLVFEQTIFVSVSANTRCAVAAAGFNSGISIKLVANGNNSKISETERMENIATDLVRGLRNTAHKKETNMQINQTRREYCVDGVTVRKAELRDGAIFWVHQKIS